MAELLELDAEVLQSHLTNLMGRLATFTDGSTERILDAGSGPGTGTLALADHFPRATVTAVDTSAPMLHRLVKRALAHGVADRIRTLEVDLDGPWPRGEPFDLVWAAAFLHHLKDPDRALRHAFYSLRPRGLLAVTEMDFFPRFLPEDAGIGRPGLEARLHAATNTVPPPDWTGHLLRAGFALEARRPVTIDLPPPPAPAVHRYAQACLTRLYQHAATEPEDLAALDTLLRGDGPLNIANRDDLTVRTTRTTWVARRP
ncbi:methyltransferase domain-containing protein [Amycolatopsis sp. RM579]|uniref:Methyltransferase domain-containing protein n=2 Tax=Amycolatopsis pithecellobii TaxID=664692 RepID=A0A6N7YTS9_9PSEU|nr:methyltransferase domain-containing protein [Amycolatopsis pithecellobii]